MGLIYDLCFIDVYGVIIPMMEKGFKGFKGKEWVIYNDFIGTKEGLLREVELAYGAWHQGNYIDYNGKMLSTDKYKDLLIKNINNPISIKDYLRLNDPFICTTIYGEPTNERELNLRLETSDEILRFLDYFNNLCHQY